MANFLKLTCAITGDELNVHVIKFEETFLGTMVTTEDKEEIFVKETPEEIMEMMVLFDERVR